MVSEVKQITVHSVGPYAKMTLNFRAQSSIREGAMLSPPRIKVSSVGTFSTLRFSNSEGVKKAQVTSKFLMALMMSFFRSHSDGIQIVPPKIKVVMISKIQASKAYEA